MEIQSLPSSFDAAEWFLNTALKDGEYLQPMKMQYLMFLAQGYYAAVTCGKRFLPAVFIATKRGPVEPNSFRLYASGRPKMEQMKMSKGTESFLETIWRRFGAYSANGLFKILSEHVPYAHALGTGTDSEISLEEMAVFYAGKAENSPIEKSSGLTGLRVMRTQSGKTVTVKKWMPAKK